MSRKLKFRAWDKISGMWLKIFNANLLNICYLSNVEINQYTGQKDDYDNEIFEDDFIIEMSENGDYFLKLIGFGNDEKEYSSILTGFKIIRGIELDLYFEENKFHGKHAYLLEKYKIKIQKGSDDEWIYFQIIGNKHENPELLELLEE